MTGTDKICELLNDYFQKCKPEMAKMYVILRSFQTLKTCLTLLEQSTEIQTKTDILQYAPP